MKKRIHFWRDDHGWTACGRDLDKHEHSTNRRKVTCATCKRSITAGAKSRPPKSARPLRPKLNRGPLPLLDDQLSASIVHMVSEGNYMETAAAVHGVAKQTLFSWLQRGARWQRECERLNSQVPKGEAVYTRFAVAMQKAQAQSQASLVTGLRSHGFADPKHWQALAWLLERKWPTQFSRRQVVQVAGAEGLEAPEVDLAKLTTAELEALDQILAKAAIDEEGED